MAKKHKGCFLERPSFAAIRLQFFQPFSVEIRDKIVQDFIEGPFENLLELMQRQAGTVVG